MKLKFIFFFFNFIHLNRSKYLAVPWVESLFFSSGPAVVGPERMNVEYVRLVRNTTRPRVRPLSRTSSGYLKPLNSIYFLLTKKKQKKTVPRSAQHR